MHETVTKRLYVGGLGSDVSSNEIAERFSRFGEVSNLSITKRTDNDGNPVKSFAHLDLTSDEGNIKKCFSTYQNTKWKGSVLKLQYAKESFLTRLEKEREHPVLDLTDKLPKVDSSQGQLNTAPSLPTASEVKASGVPGTPVPGKKDWVVGKYGRALPVLKLKKSYKLRMVKHDPSKYCHAAKIFKDDKADTLTDTSCDRLTWEIETPESEITRKRKGKFPEVSNPAKKSKGESPFLKQQKKSPMLKDSIHTKRSISERDSKEFEIVKNGTPTSSRIQATNRFDSDVESDSEMPVSSSHDITTLEKRNSVQFKSVTKSANLAQGKKHLTNRALHVSDNNAEAEGQSLVTDKFGERIESSRAIPEFKGLQMLGVGSDESESTTNKTVQLGSKERPIEKEGQLHQGRKESTPCQKERLDSVESKEMTQKRKQSDLNGNRGTPQQEGHLFNSLSDKPKVKSPANSMVDIKVKDTSDGSLRIKPGQNKHDAFLDVTKAIPEFRGLSMLSDMLDNSCGSPCQIRVPTTGNEVQQQFSPQESRKTLSQSSSSETKKKLNQLSQTPLSDSKSKSSSSDYMLHNSSSEGKKESSSSPELSLDILGARGEKSHAEGYDSASSADTDEILARCKSKRGMSSSSQKPSSATSPLDTSYTSVKGGLQQPVASGRTSSTPVLDKSLYLSEFIAGTPELSSFSPSNSSVHVSTTYDSYDSDLDSNDFELVAKKLAEKAAKTSKARSKTSHLPEKGSKKLMLRNESSGVKTDGLNFGNREQRGNENGEGSTNVSRSLVQSKMMDIANGHDTPAAALPGENEDSAQLSRKGKEKINKSAVSDRSEENGSPGKGKHVTDNEKRLQAVKELVKQKQQQQRLMKKALENVDAQNSSSSKRIVFSSSDDDASEDNGDSEDDDDDRPTADEVPNDKEKKQKQEHSKKGRLVLLENSSGDEDEESDYEEMFKSKPHFEGTKGEKLMKLQRKIGDSRFKLDAKFAESDSEEEIEESGEKLMGQNERDPSLEEEKAASLKVLENVVGKTTLDRFSEKIKKNTKHIIDMNAVRFDPTKLTSQTGMTSSANKKITDTSSPSPSKLIKMDKQGKTEVKDRKSENSAEKAERKDSEIKLSLNDKGKTDSTKEVSREKAKKKKVQKNGSENTDDKSKADLDNKSKVHLAPSLVDLFKKKQDEEETGSFSLLKQFDAADQDESDNPEIESDNESNDSLGESESKKPAVLSGLFKKVEAEKMVVQKKMDASKISTLPALLSSSVSSGGISDSDGDELESESDEEEAHQAEKKTPLTDSRNGEETDEDTEEEESLDMEDSRSPDTVQVEQMESADFADSGRVDVRYTKEQWLQRWEEIRPALVKMYKRKHKDALKNKRTQSQMRRKREFLKKSTKSHRIQKTR